MKMMLTLGVLLAVASIGNAISIRPVSGGLSGTGTTTRYWDCCKATCSWRGNTPTNAPLDSCEADGVTIIDDNTQSGCVDGGKAYVCNNQQPSALNDTFALGYAAASFNGAVDLSMCCACVLFQFDNTELSNKQMLVQITNTGTDDLHGNQFDIHIPGGGVGYNTLGCSTQWGTPEDGWGERYGGVNSESECDQLPRQLQSGCKFRFQWMKGVSNPDVSFVQVECPDELIQTGHCK